MAPRSAFGKSDPLRFPTNRTSISSASPVPSLSLWRLLRISAGPAGGFPVGHGHGNLESSTSSPGRRPNTKEKPGRTLPMRIPRPANPGPCKTLPGDFPGRRELAILSLLCEGGLPGPPGAWRGANLPSPFLFGVKVPENKKGLWNIRPKGRGPKDLQQSTWIFDPKNLPLSLSRWPIPKPAKTAHFYSGVTSSCRDLPHKGGNRLRKHSPEANNHWLS